MPKLPINQLVPQMVLAQDVHNRSGRLLAVKDLVLTKQHLVIFKTWGITDVEVVDDEAVATEQPVEAVEQLNEEQILAIMESIKPRFCLVDLRHPVIQGLLRLAAIRKAATNGQ